MTSKVFCVLHCASKRVGIVMILIDRSNALGFTTLSAYKLQVTGYRLHCFHFRKYTPGRLVPTQHELFRC